jgi:hypothetical protein
MYIFKTIYALNALIQLKLKTCNKDMIWPYYNWEWGVSSNTWWGFVILL